MSPNFHDKDYVFAMRFPRISYQVGDVVVINHPTYRLIIKRIKLIGNSGKFLIGGDNALSTNSHAFGWVSRDMIKGKVLWHCPSPNRTLSEIS